jgi:hypothetical protein
MIKFIETRNVEDLGIPLLSEEADELWRRGSRCQFVWHSIVGGLCGLYATIIT